MDQSAPPHDFNHAMTYAFVQKKSLNSFMDKSNLNRFDRREFRDWIMEHSNSDGSEVNSIIH